MWRKLLLFLMILSGCNPVAELPLPTLAPEPVTIQMLEPWQVASGWLEQPDSSGEWQFIGRAGDQIRLRVLNRGVEATMTLLLRGTIIAEGSSIDTTLPEDELYRISVRRISGSGQYDLALGYADRENPNQPTPVPQVVGVPTPTPAVSLPGEFIRELTEDETIPGMLTAQSPLHIYTYQGVGGDILSVELQRIAGTLDPVLRMFDRSGQVIAMDDNSSSAVNARLLNVRLPEDGLYSVEVSGKELFGDYMLIFQTGEQPVIADRQPTATATYVAPYITPTVGAIVSDTRLSDHAPAIGNLARSGDFQRFAFPAAAGTTFSVRAAPYGESSILPRIEIFGPDGALLASAQTAGSPDNSAFAAAIPAAETGSYIIIVTDENNNTGAYLIAAGTGVTVEDSYQAAAASNSQLPGQILRRGERHTWRVDLDPGDVITAAVSPQGGGIDPVLELANADGEILYRDDNSGGNLAAVIRSVSIEQPATYVLRVYAAGGEGTGSYTLLWRYINQAPMPTAVPDMASLLSANGRVEDGAYQFFAFQGRMGQRLLIEVEGRGQLDPVAALLAPDGAMIAQGDDNGTSLNPRFEVVLPQDGTYYLRVNGYLSAGEFDVQVALLLGTS